MVSGPRRFWKPVTRAAGRYPKAGARFGRGSWLWGSGAAGVTGWTTTSISVNMTDNNRFKETNEGSKCGTKGIEM
jgi:hypothetical protein